jgi:hypothetical protein
MLSRDDIIRIMRNLLGPQSESWDVDHAKLNEFMPLFEAIAASEREACAKVCDAVAESANKAAVAGQYLIIRNGAEARMCSAAIRAQAADRLARHGINPCPDCHGVGYDASGQLCWCTGNPSF